jgi:hypothetical protein
VTVVGIKGKPFTAPAEAGVSMAENFHDNEARHRFELDVEGKTAFVTFWQMKKVPRSGRRSE